MPTARWGAAVAVVDGLIYVVGGVDATGRRLDVVERFDPQSETWTTGLAPLPQARANAAAAAWKGSVLVLGGRDGEDKVLDEAVLYDPASDSWVEFEEMEYEREGHAAVMLAEQLYVLGGTDDDGSFVRDAEAYDADEEEWKEVEGPPMSERASFGAVAVRGAVLSIGGIGRGGPLRGVDSFDPHGGLSLQIQPLVPPRGMLGAAALGDTVFAVGGRSVDDEVLGRVDYLVLDGTPGVAGWEAMQPLRTPREHHVVAAVQGRLFVIGGRDEDDEALATVETLDVHTALPTDEVPGQPVSIALEGSYPNPFQTATNVVFTVAQQPGVPVELAVFDVQGRRVATLAEGAWPPGRHTVRWDGRDASGRRLAAGVYACRLRQGDFVESRTLVLVR